MAKKRISRKAMMTNNRGNIFSVRYPILHDLFASETPFAYSDRTVGWACDYYQLPDGMIISTGYASVGNQIPDNICKKFNETAKHIWDSRIDYETKEKRIYELMRDFEGTVRVWEGGC